MCGVWNAGPVCGGGQLAVRVRAARARVDAARGRRPMALGLPVANWVVDVNLICKLLKRAIGRIGLAQAALALIISAREDWAIAN